jgi:hypothetical protein
MHHTPPLPVGEEFVCYSLNSHQALEGGTWRHLGIMLTHEVPDLLAFGTDIHDGNQLDETPFFYKSLLCESG